MALVDVVVIGAGLAGLSCAQKLVSKGAKVVVVEARDRYGGRAETVPFGSTAVDLGCQWIHGHCSSNECSAIAKELGLPLAETDWDEAWPLYEGGADVEDEVIEKAEGLLMQVLKRAKRHPRGTKLSDAIAAEASNFPMTPKERLAFDLVKRWMVGEYAADAEEMDAVYWDCDDEALGDGSDYVFTGGNGYSQVAAHLARGLDIQLNWPVASVTSEQEGGGTIAHVACTDGARKYSAKAVVVTVPLGVLKSGAIRFSPPLPEEKVAAIRSLGMGAFNKIYLEFSESFWSKKAPAFGFASGAAREKESFYLWLNLVPTHGVNALVGYTTGEFARRCEKLTDEQMIHLALQELGLIFPKRIANAKVVRHQITRWCADPYALGAYSFIATGGTAEDRKALARPVGVIHWAGEATRLDHPSTAHGAIRSGYAAADQILGGAGGKWCTIS